MDCFLVPKTWGRLAVGFTAGVQIIDAIWPNEVRAMVMGLAASQALSTEGTR